MSFAKPFNDNRPLVHRASSCRPRNVTGLFASIFYRGSKLIYVTGHHNKGLVLRVVQEDVQQFHISQQLTWMWSKEWWAELCLIRRLSATNHYRIIELVRAGRLQYTFMGTVWELSTWMRGHSDINGSTSLTSDHKPTFLLAHWMRFPPRCWRCMM